MRAVVSTFVTVVLLSFALTTPAADEPNPVKSSQPPYKPGRQLDDGNPGTSEASEPARDGVQPVKSARSPYKPGREADEQSDAGNASKK